MRGYYGGLHLKGGKAGEGVKKGVQSCIEAIARGGGDGGAWRGAARSRRWLRAGGGRGGRVGALPSEGGGRGGGGMGVRGGRPGAAAVSRRRRNVLTLRRDPAGRGVRREAPR